MRSHTVYARAALLGLGVLAGCTGAIGDPNAGKPSGTAGTSVGTGLDDETESIPGQLNLRGSPKYYRVIRLSNAQWAASVQQVLNLSAPSGLEQNFEEAVTGTTDFSNNELVLGFDSRNWQDFQTASETLAAQVTATDAALSKVYTGTDPAGFISKMGRRIFRRPLKPAEQTAFMTLYGTGSTLIGSRSNFAKGASLVLRAMLQSPYFLFRTELGARGVPMDPYEMAAKLSLFLRGGPPDDATLDAAAASGKFDTADGAAALATKMFADPAAAATMRTFHRELLHFDDFSQISKVGVATYTEALNDEFAESSYRFFDDIFAQGRGVQDMFLSTKGYYGAGMAKLYGVAAPAGNGYAQSDLGAKRLGFFSQIPYLALNGMNGDPRSILRGVTLNLDVLCATLGPPAAVIPPIPPLVAGQTNRQRIDKLTGSCGQTCHNNMINPLGFAFEHFDGMGQWRDTENGGLAIDATGKYTFSDGSTKDWTDAASLMQVLASSPQTHICYSKKLASYALQRAVVAGDMPLLTSLTSASMAQGGSLKQLIIDVVKSDAFRTYGGPQ